MEKDVKVKDDKGDENEDYKEDNFQKYLEVYIKENNSIVSKPFYGIIKIIEKCDYCREINNIKYVNFNFINIDIKGLCNYTNYEKSKFLLEECIQYYFDDSGKIKTEKRYMCKECGKEYQRIIERKIAQLPNYLVFRVDWGKFKHDKGFECNITEIPALKPSYDCLKIHQWN